MQKSWIAFTQLNMIFIFRCKLGFRDRILYTSLKAKRKQVRLEDDRLNIQKDDYNL